MNAGSLLSFVRRLPVIVGRLSVIVGRLPMKISGLFYMTWRVPIRYTRPKPSSIEMMPMRMPILAISFCLT